MSELAKKMQPIYTAMQSAYDSVAKHYGFSCMGCQDNCCTQRFHHHTIAEYHYFMEGIKQADPAHVKEIMRKAAEVVEVYKHEAATGEIQHPMCPVNFDGLCTIYEHRPMICRLHGLPHRFRRPDGREERGGGCQIYEDSNKTDWTVNRTVLYNSLAKVERELRVSMRFNGKYSRTTAEMLLDMTQSE